MNKLASLIITTKNEEGVLRKLLQSIEKQTYKRKEVILVDNNSIDNTVRIAKKMGAKIFKFGPERSAQRNYGVKKAKGEYILILDADMELTANVVKEGVKILNNDKKIAALMIPEKSHAFSFWEKVKAFERTFYNKKGDSFTDAARFFNKNIFLKMKGYDENITGPEDWDLTERIRSSGYKIERTQGFIYHRERIKSLFELAKKKFYYAHDVHKYLKKHKKSLISPKTVYFLRPVFYKNPNKIITHPVFSIGLIIMLSIEFIAGGLGYFIGRIKSK